MASLGLLTGRAKDDAVQRHFMAFCLLTCSNLRNASYVFRVRGLRV